ncbi:MAG: signal peptidase I [bacterium]
MNTMKLTKFLYTKEYYQFILLYICFTLFIGLIGFGKLPGGLQIFTNSKSSMLPLISPSSLTIVQPASSYNVGDIISYHKQEGDKDIIVTHRIYQIGGNVYVTKGDYNEAVDSEIVRPRLVIGRVISIIPFIGAIFSLVKSPFGTIFFLILPAIFLIYFELKRVISLTRQ